MKIYELNTQNLEEIKSFVSDNIGNNIIITETNKQGKPIKIYKGMIISVYSNVFLVRLCNNGYTLNKTFTYVDFITKEFKMQIE